MSWGRRARRKRKRAEGWEANLEALLGHLRSRVQEMEHLSARVEEAGQVTDGLRLEVGRHLILQGTELEALGAGIGKFSAVVQELSRLSGDLAQRVSVPPTEEE